MTKFVGLYKSFNRDRIRKPKRFQKTFLKGKKVTAKNTQIS